MAANIIVFGFKIQVIPAYTEGSIVSKKNNFYRRLTKFCVLTPPHQNPENCINGDFNATSSIFECHCFLWREEDITIWNRNLKLQWETFIKLLLFIMIFCLENPIKHHIIWHGPNKMSKMFIDFSISNSWFRQFVTDVRV